MGQPHAHVDTDDHLAIQRLVHRYVDAVIHRDGVQWASTWADEATWDLGRGRLVHGKPAIVALWYQAMAGMHAVVQVAHTGDVRYGDSTDTAAGRWYINEWFRRGDGANGMLLAHYDDEYVRVDGEWRFSRRYLQSHYSGPADLSAEFTNHHAALVERGVPSDV
ncbi:MAG: nuclear transport factor 2 family protein [Acidimicrobiales bacterium]